MVDDPYVPDIGHIVWVSLDPQSGGEQSGRRPFLVLSSRSYNDKTSLAVGVPITSKRKGYPFEVPLEPTGAVTGVALADQIKSLDWRERQADHIDDAPADTVRDVRNVIARFLRLS